MKLARLPYFCAGFMPQPNKSYQLGLFYAILSYFIWGVFPLYWKMLAQVPAEQILAHRILWSCILLAIASYLLRETSFRKYVRNPKILLILTATAILIAANWGIYIYAVNHNQIVEASLGYYINPIVNVLLGLVFLKERLNAMQILALGFALAGLTYLTIQAGRVPVISLLLATTFAFYALLRKKAGLKSMPGLLIETMILAPFALFYLWYANRVGTGVFLHHSGFYNLLLILAGPVTAIPLFLFGVAAPKVPLTTLGFIQYLSPSMQLLIGVLLFHEKFTHVNLVSFVLVWIGLGLYMYSVLKEFRIRTKRMATGKQETKG